MCALPTARGFIRALFGNCLIFLVELEAHDGDRSSDGQHFGAFPQLFFVESGIREQSHVRSVRSLPHISY